MCAIHPALIYLNTMYTSSRVVIYTDSKSPSPATTTPLVHTLQRTLLSLHSLGWEITMKWVSFHSNIHGKDIVKHKLHILHAK